MVPKIELKCQAPRWFLKLDSTAKRPDGLLMTSRNSTYEIDFHSITDVLVNWESACRSIILLFTAPVPLHLVRMYRQLMVFILFIKLAKVMKF